MAQVHTTLKDDFLYERIIILLKQVKLVRGGTELAYTLRNHPKIRNYCREKQVQEIKDIEEYYFNPDGTLDHEAVETEFEKNSSQKTNVIIQ